MVNGKDAIGSPALYMESVQCAGSSGGNKLKQSKCCMKSLNWEDPIQRNILSPWGWRHCQGECVNNPKEQNVGKMRVTPLNVYITDLLPKHVSFSLSPPVLRF